MDSIRLDGNILPYQFEPILDDVEEPINDSDTSRPTSDSDLSDDDYDANLGIVNGRIGSTDL